MKIITLKENPKLSAVYLADFGDGKLAEFADSVQPPQKIEEKWVVLVSTLFGCPVGCKMCDAGNAMPYGGPISTADMLAQIQFAVSNRFPKGLSRIKKLKIQFARMAEPSENLHAAIIVAADRAAIEAAEAPRSTASTPPVEPEPRKRIIRPAA